MRKKLSTWLIRLALKIHPANPAVIDYYAKLTMESMILGNAIRSVDLHDMYTGPGDKPEGSVN